MKYVFFSKDHFTDGSLWIIIDSKKPNVAKIRSKDGSLVTYNHLSLEDCLSYCDNGNYFGTWRVEKYT